MGRRSCLGLLAILLGLAVLLPTAFFAIHCYRVMNEPVISGMKRDSISYGCVGSVLDPRRPRFRSESSVARRYLGARGTRGPSLSWTLNFALASWAVDASTSAEEANRMYAAAPTGRFRNFDHVARVLAGRRYCELDASRRQAVLDHYYSPRRFPVEAGSGRSSPNAR